MGLHVVTLLTIAVVLGCGKKSENESSSETVLELSPIETINHVDEAVTTLTVEDDVSEAVAGTLTIELLEDAEQDPDVPRCSTNMQAWDADEESVMDKTKEAWPGREIYCKINGSPVSPEAVRGTYNTAKGIVCELEKAGELEFSEAGVEVNLVLEPSADCFGELWIEKMMEDEEGDLIFDIDFVMTTLDEDETNWQRSIQFTLDGESPETLYFKSSDTVAAVAKYGEDGGNWSVSLDYEDGALRYELDDSRWGRHVRILGVGEVDAETGALSNVSRIEGIYSGEGAIGTIAGTVEDGYQAFAYSSSLYSSSGEEGTGNENMTFASFTKNVDACYSSSCKSDGIPFDDEDYMDFVLFEDDLNISINGPLSFDSVTFAAEP